MINPTYVNTTSAPTSRVCTLDQVKCQTNLDFTNPGEDDLLLMYIDVATELVEQATKSRLRTETVQIQSAFTEVTQFERQPFIKLPRYPLQSVTSVEVWDGTQYMATDDFNIELKNLAYARIQFQYDAFDQIATSLFDDNQAYPYRVTCVIGYTRDNLPVPLKLAIMQLVTALYDNRGDCACDPVQGILNGFISGTLSKYVVRDFFG